MAIYKKFTGAVGDGDAESVLLPKLSKTFRGSSVNKIIITNSHASNKTQVRIYLDDGSNEYDFVNTIVPALTSLVLSDNLGYESNLYDLKVNLSGAGYAITIIIK